VILQQNAPGKSRVLINGSTRRPGDCKIFVYDNAVVDNRDAGIRDLVPVRPEPGRMKRDVVGLPLPGGSAHIGEGGTYFVYPATLIVFSLEAVTVENLDFVSALEIDTAVPSRLPSRLGHERRPEFKVQLKVGEFPSCHDVPRTRDHLHDPVCDCPADRQLPLFRVAALPPRKIRPVKHHHGTLRRPGSEVR
jgi:hypothetical protein